MGCASRSSNKISTSVDILNKHCSQFRKPRIVFITQPTRSPDTNVLDLGIWNSLQSKIPFVKYDKSSAKPMGDRIIEEVMRAWEVYDGKNILTKIFNTLSNVYKGIIASNGDRVR